MERWKHWLKIGLLAVAFIPLSLSLSAAGWGGNDDYRTSRMPQGNAITDPQAILQYALPIENNAVRRVQSSLEDMATHLRARRRWFAVASDVRSVKSVLAYRREDLLESVPPEQRAEGKVKLDEIDSGATELEAAVEAQDREQTWQLRRQLLNLLGDFEALMVEDFPFEVPPEYANLPQLKGRATVEMTTDKGTISIVVDGYNAPVTGGNFVDLVQRGFYDGLPFVRAEDNYVLQVGDPPGSEDGFVDPNTGEERTIPLEIRVRSENEPIYGFTLEEIGLYREQPVLPFSAYGTVAMAHRDSDVNSASSQFFFFLFEPELTPAGLNLLDGRYAVFGYVVDGAKVLERLAKGDPIRTARVVEGLENLVVPEAPAA
ncbi:MAG: peptidylprolyl isomerase [Cyanobacteria bacterium SID2]|nr:peptidylprolyl isomerase [Cyanobacteria bacterium SID2]MBP0005889.1 peptidylprolyl isomerase [Cyanobacteria bacterium SBC]